jgi:hypothetical protein
VRFLALAVLGATLAAGAAAAAPADDRILPLTEYRTEKARELAVRHARTLRELNAEIYHCIPWVEVSKHSVGFFRPRHARDDDRYLSVRIYIEQEPSPQFAALATEERASAMFSRYVGALLRRMTRQPSLAADDAVQGFTIILEWLKQAPTAAGARPVHETIAVFVEKPDALAYVAGGLRIEELAARARILGFDGERALGPLVVSAWDDDFVSTYKIKNYQLAPGVTCALR